MRIAFLISGMGPGGAERVVSIMANYWAVKGWDVTLISFGDVSKQSFYELDKSVVFMSTRSDIRVRSRIRQHVIRIRKVRECLRTSKPDVVIAFMPMANVLGVISAKLTKLPIIISERNDPTKQPLNFLWKFLRRLVYPLANLIVVQTASARTQIEGLIHATNVVIPNPVIPNTIGTRKTESSKKTVISVGSLGYQKGFDILIKAFSKAHKKYPEWKLIIWGDGPLRASLSSLINKENMSGYISLPGITKDVHHEMNNADIYVLSSRWEGFPNALCEAMACGLPAIATNCPSGPSEIITNMKDGIIVPVDDVELMAESLEMLIGDQELRKKLGLNAKTITERFSLVNVMNLWEREIETLLNI